MRQQHHTHHTQILRCCNSPETHTHDARKHRSSPTRIQHSSFACPDQRDRLASLSTLLLRFVPPLLSDLSLQPLIAMAPVKIGINGFGRIGRLVFRAALAKPELVEVVAYNDPFLDPKYAAYQLKYDSVHGRFKGTISYDKDNLIVNGKKIRAFKAKTPAEMSARRSTQHPSLSCS
jgi:Glyceraldehyde 3-phosphate dehydrogenase, NAD binding domain